MASTSSNATITLDLQGTDASQQHSTAIDNLITSLNRFAERVEKISSSSSSNVSSISGDVLDKKFERINQEYEKNVDKQTEREIKLSQYRMKKVVDAQEKLINEQINNDLKMFEKQERIEQDKLDKLEKQQIKEEKILNQKFEKINQEYEKNAQQFNKAMIGIGSGLLISGAGIAADYAKGSNALIGANLYDRPLKEAQKSIQENKATNEGISSLVAGGVGGLAGAFLGPLAGMGAYQITSNITDKVAGFFSDKYARHTTLEANIERQQRTISSLTGESLTDFTNPNTGNTIKTTQDFAQLAKNKDMDYALSFQAAQQGVLLNTTGTQGVTGNSADALAKTITNNLGQTYNTEQLQQFSSVMSGLFAHSGLADSSKKQSDILQKIFDNSSKYGVDPTQYAQEVYKRQQFMGGSPDSAMQYVNTGVVQGWNYANTIQQLERASVSQRLNSTFALSMVGYGGTYEDLFKSGGIDKLQQKAGDLKDPFNINAMILQNAGIDLWSLKSGGSQAEAQEDNTKAILDNIRALNELTGAILNNGGSSMTPFAGTQNANSYDQLVDAIGKGNINSASKSVKWSNTMVPPIYKVTH